MDKNQSHDPKRLEYFAQALQTEEEDILTCQEVEDLLPEYRHTVWMAQHEQQEWQDVTRHLASCPSCSTQYEMLIELENDTLTIDIEVVHKLVEPNPPPSQLAQPHSQPPEKSLLSPAFWTWDLATLLVDLGEALRNAMPQPPMRPEGVRRSDSKRPNLVYEFAIDDLDEADVFIIIKQSVHAPDEYDLMVHVDLKSDDLKSDDFAKGDPLQFNETEVVLHLPDSSSQTQLVDGLGEVHFRVARSDLEAIRLEIIPDNQ